MQVDVRVSEFSRNEETKVVSNSLPRITLSIVVSAVFLDNCIYTDCFAESPGAGLGTGFSVGC